MKNYHLLLVLTLATLMGCMQTASNEKGELVFNDPNAATTTSENNANSLEAFKTTVYPLVTSKTCVNCHGVSQSPKFAVEDVEEAFTNLTSSNKVDLADPESSRIVVKIVDQSHNCWSDSCEADSQEMLEAVQAWADAIGDEAAQDVGDYVTSKIGFPSESAMAQTEYGTIILQAEQTDASVLKGRFEIYQDSDAIGQSFIKGPLPSSNPHTSANRSASINTSGCEVPSDSEVALDRNGAFRISEASTHITSQTRTVTNGSEYVKDGFVPYTYNLIGQLIRPDRRLDYAKALISGELSDNNVAEYLVLDGSFESVSKLPGVEAPELDGDPVTYTVTRILPHFVEYEDVFDDDGSFLDNSHVFTKDDGSTANLYELFSEGSYEPTNAKVFSILKNKEELKKKVAYYRLKNSVVSLLSADSITYARIQKLDPAQFLSTQEINIQLDCRDEWEGLEDEPVYDASPEGPFKNCDPDREKAGKYSYLRYEAVDDSSSLDKLTYSNALDKLTVNSAGTAIISADSSAISSGQWFHRIDLYQSYKISINSKSLNNDFSRTYKTGQSGSFVESETFTNDSSYGSNGTITYDLNKNNKQLNLAGIFTGDDSGLDDGLKLENFENTLYPVIQNARCVDCHSSGSNIRFAQENSSLAMKVIEDNSLVNFADPGDSFRGRGGGVVHNCNNNSSDERYDCSNDSTLKEAMINAIKSWKSENEADTTGDGVTALSTKQKTPGRASYKFKVTEAGYYNVWFRIKAGSNNRGFYYQVKDSNGNALSSYKTSGSSPITNKRTCETFNFSNTSWKWTTVGREDELDSLDFLGNRIYDEQKNVIDVDDNRIYWNLPVGEYSIEFYEKTPDSRIDLVALNKVEDFSDDGRLNFQPDLITADEKYIASYNRKVLSYDLSSFLDLQEGESARFEIEVRREYDGQNYIFKGPRFYFEGSNSQRKLYVKSVRGLINGKHSFTDSTYTDIDYILGLGRVITYAPLVTLIPDPTDYDNDKFSFAFEELKVVEADDYTELNPKGESATVSDGRECLELSLFVNTVKPILKYARVSLADDYNSFVSDFPGSAGANGTSLETYRCMTCHNEDHPYFKMTTFDFNDDILCKQAISRVDFENFYQSTIVRGINGTNNHPQFNFIEEFQLSSDESTWKTHDGEDNYLDGFAMNEASGLQTRYVHGPAAIFTKSELGLGSASDYSSLSEANKTKAQLIGSFKRIEYLMIPTDPDEIGGYNDLLHYDLLGTKRGENDIIDPNHDPDLGENNENEDTDPLYLDRGDAGRAMYLHPSSTAYMDNPKAFTTSNRNLVGLTLLYSKDSNNHRTSTLDYRGDLSGTNTKAELTEEFERVRTKYREAIINWIRAEDAAYKAKN